MVSRTTPGARSQRPGVTDPASIGAPSRATSALPGGPTRSVMRGQSLMAWRLPAGRAKGETMWDLMLVDCHLATMDPAVQAPFGAIENAAIGIADGRVVRVGRRSELAGYRAAKVEALGGAWVTPGLIDCHTHLVFGGNRAH